MAYIYTGCSQIQTLVLRADGYVQITVENLDGSKGEKYVEVCLTPAEAGRFAQALIDDAEELHEEHQATVAHVVALKRKAAQAQKDSDG